MLLAVALNVWPWLTPASPSPSFAAPARMASRDAAPFFQEEFIDRDSPYPMAHVASIAELPNGRLAAVWYAGSREGAGDVAIFLSSRAPATRRGRRRARSSRASPPHGT